MVAERHGPRQLRVDIVQAGDGLGDGGETVAPPDSSLPKDGLRPRRADGERSWRRGW
jgi:hypothetical protein